MQELPLFSEYITMLAEERNEKAEAVIRRGEIESSFGHKLFSGTRNPSRDTVLQLAFGFELNADETQQLLKVARATALHPRVKEMLSSRTASSITEHLWKHSSFCMIITCR